MFLSAELFESIVKALKSDGRRGNERRHDPRAGLSTRMEIIPVEVSDRGVKPVAVFLRDLSVTGLGIACEGAMRSGSQFVVRLPRSDGEPLVLLCQAVHSRKSPGRQNLIGARLVRELRREELVRVLSGMPIDPGKIDKTEKADKAEKTEKADKSDQPAKAKPAAA